MPYRNDFNRSHKQVNIIADQNAHVVTWRQYVSASGAGASNVAGFGDKPSYREQQISAFFTQSVGIGGLPLGQNAYGDRAAGMLQAGDMRAVTSQPLAPNDELIWRGDQYRVDSEATPARMDGWWVSTVKRGQG